MDSPTSGQYGEEKLVAYLHGRRFSDAWEQYQEEGYVIFPEVLTKSELTAQSAALAPWIAADIKGRNDFEGVLSNRIYAMLAKDKIFADLVTHPLQLAFVERELGESALLYALLAINLHPGETAQPWHYDDDHCRLPRPRANMSVSTFWSIDETTDSNGATEILPGSHRWDGERPQGANRLSHFSSKSAPDQDADPGARPDAIQACMPAGSLMIAKGTLWHRGGANRSTKPRMIVTPQFCYGWMRPLETMLLAVPPEKAKLLPERAQRLLGYDIHAPFMGYLDGMHPSRILR